MHLSTNEHIMDTNDIKDVPHALLNLFVALANKWTYLKHKISRLIMHTKTMDLL